MHLRHEKILKFQYLKILIESENSFMRNIFFSISANKMRDSSYLVLGLLIIEIMLHKSISSLVAALRRDPEIWNVTRLLVMVLSSSH